MSYSFNKHSAVRSRSYAGHSSRRTSRPSRVPRGDYINPARFVSRAVPAAETAFTPLHAFADFDVQPMLKQNLESNRYTTPTAIQDQTIPAVLAGKDVVGLASTGTGKTLAFALPIAHQLMTDRTKRALILAPTRELAQQIEAECRVIAKGSGLRGVVLIGGSAMGPQLRDLRDKPHIVIGTPGRIQDHVERSSLSLPSFNIIVLDEVDRMLDMGFVSPITKIFGAIAPQHQSLFFSATMDERVSRLIRGFSRDPVTISVNSGVTAANINQDVIRFISAGEKIEKLHSALNGDEVQKVIIFDETQRNVERLNKELAARGFATDAIHGGKNQNQRQRALKRFKDNEVTVLVATNVAARGIDVVDVTHVINYSVPQTYDDYIHRIGRAGRAGKVGHALTFVPAG